MRHIQKFMGGEQGKEGKTLSEQEENELEGASK
jgi:hypothetical protein